MKLAITGHRPDKLPRLYETAKAIGQAYDDLGATYVYQGQAPGADIKAAMSCYFEQIPYCAVVPWAGHKDSMPDAYWLSQWEEAIKYADRVEVLSDSKEYLGPWLYHNRNQFMVDHADAVLAIWDRKPGGGTASTVEYAWENNKDVFVIDPFTLEVSIAG